MICIYKHIFTRVGWLICDFQRAYSRSLHRYTYVRARAYTRAHTHVHTHTCTHTRAHTHTFFLFHSLPHTHTHTRGHTHAHTYTRTHTHTQTRHSNRHRHRHTFFSAQSHIPPHLPKTHEHQNLSKLQQKEKSTLPHRQPTTPGGCRIIKNTTHTHATPPTTHAHKNKNLSKLKVLCASLSTSLPFPPSRFFHLLGVAENTARAGAAVWSLPARAGVASIVFLILIPRTLSIPVRLCNAVSPTAHVVTLFLIVPLSSRFPILERGRVKLANLAIVSFVISFGSWWVSFTLDLWVSFDVSFGDGWAPFAAAETAPPRNRICTMLGPPESLGSGVLDGRLSFGSREMFLDVDDKTSSSRVPWGVVTRVLRV